VDARFIKINYGVTELKAGIILEEYALVSDIICKKLFLQVCRIDGEKNNLSNEIEAGLVLNFFAMNMYK